MGRVVARSLGALPLLVGLHAPLLTSVAMAAQALAPAHAVALPSSTDATIDVDMQARARACTTCHGDDGRSTPYGYQPRLAGKPAEYLTRQLIAFRDGTRRYGPMEHLLKGLSDAYLQDFGAYFAALRVPYQAPPPPEVDPATLDRGRRLANDGDAALGLAACTDCHGPALRGDDARIPGLTGLPRAYLSAQLGAWRSGQRRTPGSECMTDIANRLSPQDVLAVTAWIAIQPVADPSEPAPVRSTIADERCPVPMLATSARPPQSPASPSNTDDPLVARGRYLARLGNCEGCHSLPGDLPYASGPALRTRFGTFRAPNITPDPEHGIGDWHADDFWRALHEGRSRDGRALYPAFPYVWYSGITRADSDAMFAFLRSLEPSPRPREPHALSFPASSRVALWAWRALWFEPASHAPDPDRDADWNRGAYLALTLGHCGACHTGRNFFGAPTASPSLNGADVPTSDGDEPWFAPSLRDPAQGSVAHWSQSTVQRWLTTGIVPGAVASGPMGEVIHGSLQYLTPDDARALGVWLRALPTATGSADAGRRQGEVTTASVGLGEIVYATHCADCHGKDGRGSDDGEYPPLAGNRQVTARNLANLRLMLRHGGFAPASAAWPRPAGMPPYATELRAVEIDSVIMYIRNAWGNVATR